MPSYTAQVDRTSISIFASNPEPRSYTAIINFTWRHDDFEGNAIENRTNATVTVGPRLNQGKIYYITGVNVQVLDDVSVKFQ